MTRPLDHELADSWRHLLRLGHFDHGIAEIRVIGGGLVRVGFFDDGSALIQALTEVAEGNVYIGVQPRPRGMLERAPNQLATGVRGASSDEIETLTTLMVDIDPVRAEGSEKQAATNAELAHGLEAARGASEWLASRGFARPALAMTGNGAQLLFRVPATPLDTDDRDALEQGAKLFEAEVRAHVETLALPVKIDRTSDWARIGKLVGTVSRKGDGKGDRPHRVSRWVELPQGEPDDRLLRHVMTLGTDELRRIDDERHRLREELQRREASVARKAASKSAELSNLERGQLWLEPVLADVRAHGHPHDGSRGTWRVSEHLTRGFGLSVGEAFPLLREYVLGCSGPPWTDAELERKLNEALTRGKLPMGYLLDARRNESQPNTSASNVARVRREGARDHEFGPLHAYDQDAATTGAEGRQPSASDNCEGNVPVNGAADSPQQPEEPHILGAKEAAPKKPVPNLSASGEPAGSAEVNDAAEEPATRDTGGRGAKPKLCLNNHPDDRHLELHALIEDAARVLGEHAPEVFCRSGQLVDAGPVEIYLGKRKRDDGPGHSKLKSKMLGVRQLPISEVQRHLSRAASWSKWVLSKRKKIYVEVPADPTPTLAAQVANMGRWPTVRPLAGVLTAPSLRPDGSIIQEPGWDEATEYLYDPTREYPCIPDRPSRDDAAAALTELREVFAPPGEGFDGFPFATEADGFVPIANVLTLLARPAIDGCTPAFVYDATTPGTGKGLLADVVCTIATGEDLPKGVFTDDADELKKHLGSLVLAGAAVCGFDNIDQHMTFSGGALDAVLTARRPQLRVLGKSEAPAIDWTAVVVATGNNVQIVGDTERRCIRCRQEPDVERPEERSNFRIPNLLAYVREHRPRLVCAGLTLLRAYFVAGQPKVEGKPYGSFEAWQQVVANAIVWAGGTNVVDCRAKNDEGGDPELDAAATLLGAMHRIGKAMSAGELIAEGYENTYGIPGAERNPDIREALDVLVSRKDKNGRPTPKAMGWVLKRIRGRVFGGLRLLSQPSGKGGKNVEWIVRPVPGSGTSGASCTSPYPLRGRDRAGETSDNEGKQVPESTEVLDQPSEGGHRVLFRGPLAGPRRVPS